MEWNVQAPSSYSGYVFVGKFDFAGTLTAVPSPAPICPVPQVQSIIPLPRPLWESLGETPENLDRDFTLFNGSTIRVPTTIWSLPR